MAGEHDNINEDTEALDSLTPGSHPADIPENPSKAALMKQLLAIAGGIDTSALKTFMDSMASIGHEADNIAPNSAAKNKATIATKPSLAVAKEDIESLFPDDSLSEEFKTKASEIFEAAIEARIIVETARIEEAYEEAINKVVEESYDTVLEQVTEKVDQYLNYCVEQWLEEHKVEAETAIRTDISEKFIEGLKDLFKEHYIEIPEDKVNVVEELTLQVEDLNTKLNSLITKNIELTTAITEAKKIEIVKEASNGLTLMQADKFNSLLEDVDFDNEDSFKTKVKVIRESYFDDKPTTKKVNSQLVVEEITIDPEQVIEEEVITGPMAKYVKAIKSTTKNSFAGLK